MSINSKQVYRFGYLKSEQWKSVRLEALVREKGKCQICGEFSISNDAHHIWYPERLVETKEHHLVVLCRACHAFVHAVFPECDQSDECAGIERWNRFSRAVQAWRRMKIEIFRSGIDIDSPPGERASELRIAYATLKKRHQDTMALLAAYQAKLTEHPSGDFRIRAVNMLREIESWAEAYEKIHLTDFPAKAK